MRKLIAIVVMMVAGVAFADEAPKIKSEHLSMAVAIAKHMGQEAMQIADTHSMEPTLYATDIALIEKVAFEDLKVGDIVVFKRRYRGPNPYGSNLVAHRIVRKEKGFVVTKGDNPELDEDPDKPGARAIVGRVALVMDGLTGEVRDMRVSREGQVISLAEALGVQTAVASAQ